MAVMFGDDDTWVIVSTMPIQRKLAFDTEERRRRRGGRAEARVQLSSVCSILVVIPMTN